MKLTVEPWEGINPLCDERIVNVQKKAEVPIGMKPADGKIVISADLPTEQLRTYLKEENIVVLDK